MDKTEQQIAACPFCGGRAKLNSYRVAEDAMGCRVECLTCRAKTDDFEDAYTPAAEAIAAWNRRAPVTQEPVAWRYRYNTPTARSFLVDRDPGLSGKGYVVTPLYDHPAVEQEEGSDDSPVAADSERKGRQLEVMRCEEARGETIDHMRHNLSWEMRQSGDCRLMWVNCGDYDRFVLFPSLLNATPKSEQGDPAQSMPGTASDQKTPAGEVQVSRDTADRLEAEREELMNSFGQGSFHDGLVRQRIERIDAELKALKGAEQ